jgi:PIN domain nuclease of toxin-antitoxin system
VNLLLDSHVAVWWAQDPDKLVPEASALLADPMNDVWVSTASAWELALKVEAGKLMIDVRRLFAGLQVRGVRVLGIGIVDGIDAAALDWSNRDPFDRILVAQTNRSGLRLLTRDRAILGFDAVESLRA